jgi:cell division control protein 6
LDEIDHVASSSQALTSLFTLAHIHASSLRLIGIANTHTLSSSSCATSASLEALAGVETMHFSPYTPAQLQEIVEQRLAPIKNDSAEALAKFLPPATVMLLTKKVAAMTGDVRAVFEVLRGAINIAINIAISGESATVNSIEAVATPVTPGHILSALKAYNPASNTSKAMPGPSMTPKKACDSEIVVKVRELGLQARLVLLAMVLARRRLDAGLTVGGTSSVSTPSSVPRTPTKRSQSMADCASGSGVDGNQLHTFYKAILGRTDNAIFTPVSRSEFGDILGLLETVGLLQLSGAASLPSTPSKSGKRALARSASFGGAIRAANAVTSQEVRFVEGVRTDEILRGLGIQDVHSKPVASADGDVLEEEIRAVFEKERIRIVRESKSKLSGATVADTFEGAVAA